MAFSKAKSCLRPSSSSGLTGASSYLRSSTMPSTMRMLEASVTGSAGSQPARCMMRSTSASSPTSPTLMGSPGMPSLVMVSMGTSARPF